MGSWLGILWFDILRFRRQIIFDNMAIAFPDSTQEWRTRTARRQLRLFGANFSEFFTLPQLDQEWLKKNVVIEGKENYDLAMAKDRGVYFLSLHLGAYDVGANLLPMIGIETHLITKFFRSQWLNRFWFSLRGAQGGKFIEPHGERTAFDILKAIKRKASVVFVFDQFMGRPFGIPTTFFGRETGTAYGLALFVLKTRSPVIPVYTFHDTDGKIHLKFEQEVAVETLIDPNDKDESIRRMTQTFNDRLEVIIRQHPDEWMWVHRRWKEYE